MGQLDCYRDIVTQLNQQRRRLGFTYAMLAKKSGVSVPTVTRILSGGQVSAHFDHMLAIADALGMDLQTRIVVDADAMREEQAREKARQLVELVQGTSALEAQAVDQAALHSMIEKTVHELLAGSPRNLWAD